MEQVDRARVLEHRPLVAEQLPPRQVAVVVAVEAAAVVEPLPSSPIRQLCLRDPICLVSQKERSLSISPGVSSTPGTSSRLMKD